MIRRPPRSTRTVTLLPDTTLSRSRRIRPVGDAVQALATLALLHGRREILADARHAPRTQRLDPRLLQGLVEHRGHIAARHAARMELGVMIADLQRDRIGLAAQLGDFLRRQIAAREGNAGAIAGDAGRLV